MNNVLEHSGAGEHWEVKQSLVLVGSPPLLLIDSSQLPTAPGEGNRNQIYVKLSFTFCFALTYPIVLLLLHMAYIGRNIF